MMTDAQQNARAIKAERNRFLGFAFASADLLIQVDDLLTMTFVTGASSDVTGHVPTQLVGQPLINIFHESQRGYVISALCNLEPGKRLQPISAKLLRADQQLLDVIVGGFQMDSQEVYLSVMRADRLWINEGGKVSRDSSSGLMSQDSYIDAMTQRLNALSDEERQITSFVIEGLEDLRENADPKTVEAFLSEVGDMIRSLSIGGDSSGHLGPNAMSLMHTHETAAELAAMEQKIQEKAQSAGLGNIKIRRFNLDLDVRGLTDEDAAKALGYALQKFSQHGVDSDFNIRNLTEAAQSYIVETADRVNTMRAAMDPDRVIVAFQPVVKLESRDAWYYESAVRLEGFSSPREMLAFAETLGMTADFDLLVIDKIIEQLKAKATHGFTPKVALNVAVTSLASPLFLGSLRSHIKNAGSAGKQIAIEINDAAAVTDLTLLDGVIQKIREDGLPVAIDNVGVGRTMDILRDVKVDYVKLAPDLVTGYLEDSTQEAVLKSTIAACRSMKYVMVAEGVQSEDEARGLKTMGVQYGQGVLFGRPSTGGQGLSYKPGERNVRKRGVSVTW